MATNSVQSQNVPLPKQYQHNFNINMPVITRSAMKKTSAAAAQTKKTSKIEQAKEIVRVQVRERQAEKSKKFLESAAAKKSSAPSAEEVEMSDYIYYHITDNIGVPIGANLTVFFPGTECLNATLEMPDNVPLGGCMKLRLPVKEPVPKVIHHLVIEEVSDDPPTDIPRTEPAVYYVNSSKNNFVAEITQHLESYSNPPPNCDPYMHMIRTLTELFFVLNKEEHRDVLMMSELLPLRHVILMRCDSFKRETDNLTQSRIEGAKELIEISTITRSKSSLTTAEEYYTQFRDNLHAEINKFHDYYRNRL